MTWKDRLLMRLFGRPEGRMGQLGGAIMAHLNRPFAQWVVERLSVQPDDRIIEIGFGPGVALELLAARAVRGMVAGVDPSTEMLRQAHCRNTNAIGEGRVELRLRTAEALPFGDASFDKALAINSMQLWTDVAAGLGELRRVVKPGGLIALGFTRHARQRQADAVAALQRAGWRHPEVATDRRGYCLLVRNS